MTNNNSHSKVEKAKKRIPKISPGEASANVEHFFKSFGIYFDKCGHPEVREFIANPVDPQDNQSEEDWDDEINRKIRQIIKIKAPNYGKGLNTMASGKATLYNMMIAFHYIEESDVIDGIIGRTKYDGRTPPDEFIDQVKLIDQLMARSHYHIDKVEWNQRILNMLTGKMADNRPSIKLIMTVKLEIYERMNLEKEEPSITNLLSYIEEVAVGLN